MGNDMPSSTEKLVGAWIFGIILIVIGCISVYYSFKPMSQLSCYNNNEEEMMVNIACSPLNTSKNKDKECESAKIALDKKNQMCSVKKPNRSLLYGILLIPFGIIIIMYAICRNHKSNNTGFSKSSGGLGLLNKYQSIL